ncbi:branched-chain-amino-acid aminotransferase, mitochondrial-like [Alexandromys fortis]|uniref:branched-chain-amino-acid aminotransferase, mitochondrial-like n=1 Tax=Alexandromys fortis TaxID=100897 RepID=UPI0021532100|nr:branched-chain-amino-acid aminotransferase, mitochondrial-like [Microtus fortis]
MAQHGEVATFFKAPLLASEWPVCSRRREGRGWLSESGALTPTGSTQDFDKQELLECIRRLIEVDKDWVPDGHGSSLCVRPVLIGNEALAQDTMRRCLSLLRADQVQATGISKQGSMTIQGGYSGPLRTHEDGILELATPALDGLIVPAVVRLSLLDLARSWCRWSAAGQESGDYSVSVPLFRRALEQGRLREIFGSGTVCQICPVHQILYEGKKLHILTTEKWPELILRFQNKLKAIQVSSGVATLIMNTCGQKHGNFLCFGSLCGFGS